jgi:hypothetical protein
MLDVPGNGDPKSLRYSHIQYLIGYVNVYSGKPDEALEAFENSLNSRPGPSHAMKMAALMATNTYNRGALVLADRALTQLRKEIAQDPKLVRKVNESDILGFQESVSSDLALQQGASTPDAAD